MAQIEMTLGPGASAAVVTLTHPLIDTKLAYVHGKLVEALLGLGVLIGGRQGSPSP